MHIKSSLEGWIDNISRSSRAMTGKIKLNIGKLVPIASNFNNF
jgi:hypothetical protein